jgi:transcriptional regulator with XRE-family HTH domain
MYRHRGRRKPPARTKERLAVGRAIRDARRSSGLTQEALGKRLGLDAQAVYRWEVATSTPSKRNERELIQVLQAVHPRAAAELAESLTAIRASEGKPGIAHVVPPAVPAGASVELAVFALAEDLALAPRLVRSALVPFVQRLRAARVPLDEVERVLAALLQSAGPSSN